MILEDVDLAAIRKIIERLQTDILNLQIIQQLLDCCRYSYGKGRHGHKHQGTEKSMQLKLVIRWH